MIRPWYRSRLFWLGVPGLVFLAWLWVDSMRFATHAAFCWDTEPSTRSPFVTTYGISFTQRLGWMEIRDEADPFFVEPAWLGIGAEVSQQSIESYYTDPFVDPPQHLVIDRSLNEWFPPAFSQMDKLDPYADEGIRTAHWFAVVVYSAVWATGIIVGRRWKRSKLLEGEVITG